MTADQETVKDLQHSLKLTKLSDNHMVISSGEDGESKEAEFKPAKEQNSVKEKAKILRLPC